MSKKKITMLVTVSVPDWLSAADARREVRTLLNEQCFYGAMHPEGLDSIDEYNFRAARVASLRG